MIKVLLVDDHALIRAAVRKLLENQPDIEVVGEASNGDDALAQARALEPDIVLLDISMPGMSGIEVTRRLQHLGRGKNIKVIALSAHQDKLYISQLLKTGAEGYLTKGVGAEELIHALHVVYNNLTYLTPQIAEKLASSYIQGQGESPFDSLTHREVEIMLMVCNGEKVPAIAKKLFISAKTVNGYRQQIFKKLGVNSDLEMTKLLVQHGLLEP